MRTLYTLGIQFYFLAISLARLFGNRKAKLWTDGRKNWKSRLNAIPKNSKVIWFHAASLGEFEQARPLIEKIKKENKSDYILLTFFSPSGYEIQKNYAFADLVIYLPLDTKANAREFIKLLRPKLAVFVKYEFWFNYLFQLKKEKIKTILVSGIFRENQHFFKFYGRWFRNQLSAFSHFYVQNEASKKLLSTIGYSHVSVVGDTRFDRVYALAQEEFIQNRFDSFSGSEKLIVIGSSWKEEVEIAYELMNHRKDVKLIIAPHEIDQEQMHALKNRFHVDSVLFSETDVEQDLSQFRILIIDQIGLLSKLYRFAELAIVGGGFGKGIHNILEAAVYGSPVLFGPNYQKFQEAKDLIQRGGAFSGSQTEILSKINDLLNEDDQRMEASSKAKEYVRGHLGATDKIFADVIKN